MQNGQAPINYIRCQAGGVYYALPMAQVRSIERVTALDRELGDAGQVGWVMTVTSERIPVYGLAQRVGQLQTAVSANPRILVLHHPEKAWALLVDSVAQITADKPLPLPKSLQSGRSYLFRGILQTNQGSALVLNTVQLHPDAVPPEPTPVATESVEPKVAAEQNGMPKPQSDKHIVVFRLPEMVQNGRPISFGLSINQVAELIDPLDILPLASDSPYVQGVVEWREQTVPLLRLVPPEWTQEKEAEGEEDASQTLLQRLLARRRERFLIVRSAETGALAALRVEANVRALDLPIPHRPSDRELPFHPLLVSGCVELARETLVIPNIQAALIQSDLQLA